jgi:hypothetical protein
MQEFIDKKTDKSPEEIENLIIGLFTTVYTRTVKEVTKKYGEEGFNLLKKAFIDSVTESSAEAYKDIKNRDLKSFIDWISTGLAQGHKYEYTENTEKSVQFKFTNCSWATFFRAVNAPEIGHFFCDCDEPMVNAFNKKIKFERTKTLMDGDDCCNHHYFVEDIE